MHHRSTANFRGKLGSKPKTLPDFNQREKDIHERVHYRSGEKTRSNAAHTLEHILLVRQCCGYFSAKIKVP